MDVRCEKCNTEYELDESRLKPGGVTVKCTTCGHMFKIRKRTPTQSGTKPGVPVVRVDRASVPVPAAAPAAPTLMPLSPSGPAAMAAAPRAVPEPRAQTGSGPVTAGEGERNWIIRLEGGEQRSCKELGMLQQWIITGAVSRESMISRSGKTWKRLGDIAELASFFIVAEEARTARGGRDSGQITPPRGAAVPPDARATLLGVPITKPVERETVVEPLRAPGSGRVPTAAPPPPPPPKHPTGPNATMRMAAPAPPPNATLRQPPAFANAAAPTMLAAAPPTPLAPRTGASTPPPLPPPASRVNAAGPAMPPPPNERSTGGWATDDIVPMNPGDSGDGEHAGPGPMRGAVRPAAPGDGSFGGIVRPAPTDDAAFVGGLAGRTGRVGVLAGPDVPDLFDNDDDLRPPRSGATVWIALGSLVVIAAAAAVVYFVFLRTPKVDRTGAAAGADDAGVVAATDDGGASIVTPTADAATLTASEDLLDEARVHLGRESVPGLIAAEKRLAESSRADATSLAMRARLITAHAQILEDEAAYADAKTADKVRRESKKQVLSALGLVQKALRTRGDEPLANAVMADVLRLQGKPAKDLRRYLDAAGDDREGKLVGALVALRDKELDQAATTLAGLDAGGGALEATGDVRPRWYRARVAHAQGKADDARRFAEEVIAAQPAHGGARALLAKLGAVASGDPMPPEDGNGTGTGTGPGTGPGTASDPGPGTAKGTGAGTGGTGPIAGDSYDKLLAKANKLAEVDCGQAMPYFSKALEAQPNGVEALTGMGFCHIDAKQFASAHSKFRAALGISPRFERALWGVAEAYQQQGRTDLAVKSYEDYLEVYPNSAAAKRQLDRLKGNTQGTPTPPEGGGTGTATPTPTPEPQPDPPRPDPPKPDPGPETGPTTTP